MLCDQANFLAPIIHQIKEENSRGSDGIKYHPFFKRKINLTI